MPANRPSTLISSSSSLSDLLLQHIDLFENIKFGTNLFHFKINWLYEESDRLPDSIYIIFGMCSSPAFFKMGNAHDVHLLLT